jgi:hypothetical protein
MTVMIINRTAEVWTETPHILTGMSWLSSVPSENAGLVPRLSHVRFLPNTSQLIIPLSSDAAYSLDIENSRNTAECVTGEPAPPAGVMVRRHLSMVPWSAVTAAALNQHIIDSLSRYDPF